MNRDATWDAFISHASEDTESFAGPLADELAKAGLKVWFDQFTLEVGDSLRECIDRGLSDSRFGIVVLSHAFFSKRWPQNELNGLIARESFGGKVILPVWHDITAEEVAEYSPLLADRVAVSSDAGIAEVARKLADVIHHVPPHSKRRHVSSTSSVAGFVSGQPAGRESELRINGIPDGSYKLDAGLLDRKAGTQFVEADLSKLVRRLPRNTSKAIMFFDVDDLTIINRHYSREVGDAVLCIALEKIRSDKGIKLCGRCGDDTFYAFVEKYAHEEAARAAGRV